MTSLARGGLAAVCALSMSTTVWAQESRSASLAKQVAAALDAAKIDSIAAIDPLNPDGFIGALYFPGVQLLVVSAKYSAPMLLTAKLAKKEYRDVYIDLNSASVPDSKVFVEDLGADGLSAKHEDNKPYDSFESGGKRMPFDSDWKKQKLTEQDYMKAFSAADERYSQMLTALLAQLKKTS